VKCLASIVIYSEMSVKYGHGECLDKWISLITCTNESEVGSESHVPLVRCSIAWRASILDG
jgi:hypothetical protein